MISLIDIKKIFNKTILGILIIYAVLFACAYAFIYFSDTTFERSSSLELIKHAHWYNIFIHNITSSFMLILLGNISFGIVSTIFFLYDFYLLVFAAYGAYLHSGSFLYSFAALLTHGIVELVAIAFNVYLSTLSFRYLLNRIYKENIFHIENSKEILKLIVAMASFFFIASLIEAFATPNLLKFIME